MVRWLVWTFTLYLDTGLFLLSKLSKSFPFRTKIEENVATAKTKRSRSCYWKERNFYIKNTANCSSVGQTKTTGLHHSPSDGTYQTLDQEGCIFKTCSVRNELQRDNIFAFHLYYKTIFTLGNTQRQRQMSFTGGKKQQRTTFSASQLIVQTRLKETVQGHQHAQP